MRRQVKRLIDSIVQTKDCPHRMARGVAVGMLVGWTPTVGIQMIVAAFAAWLARANKLAAVGMVWISNPYTMIPIYWFNYEVGYFLVGGTRLTKDRFIEIFLPKEQLTWFEKTTRAWYQLLEIMGPMFVGSLVVGIPLAVICYYLTLRGVRNYRSAQAALGLDTSDEPVFSDAETPSEDDSEDHSGDDADDDSALVEGSANLPLPGSNTDAHHGSDFHLHRQQEPGVA